MHTFKFYSKFLFFDDTIEHAIGHEMRYTVIGKKLQWSEYYHHHGIKMEYTIETFSEEDETIFRLKYS